MKRSSRIFANEVIIYREIEKDAVKKLEKFNYESIKSNDDGIKYKLTPIGEGTTCVAYVCEKSNVKRYILKEFYPMDDQGVLLVSRDEHDSNNPLKLWKKSNEDKVNHRFKSFVCSSEVTGPINEKYQSENGNIRIAPRFYETSLGYCMLCEYNGGRSLSECVSDDVQKVTTFKEKLSLALRILYKVLSDLNVYHIEGYVNFDIKSENLFFCNDDVNLNPQKDGLEIYGYSCIRNLDFSSCKNMSDLINELTSIKSDVKFEEYLTNNMASTERYYSSCEVRAALKFCRSNKYSEEEKKNCLKRLDIIALMKVFVQIFLPDDTFEENQELYFALRYVFEENLTSDDNFYEYYYILSRLKDMLDKIISYETPTAYELMRQVSEIESALDGDVYIESDNVNGQKNAIILCKTSFGKKYSSLKNDESLKKEIFGENSPSFAKLLEFCDENNISSPSELNSHLLFKY